MRTSDPVGYDNFNAVTGAFPHRFRGLYFTAGSGSSAIRVTVTIQLNRVDSNGTLSSVTKTIDLNASAGGSVYLPISGDAITALTNQTANSLLYALI